mgnify:CR=1 FL=1
MQYRVDADAIEGLANRVQQKHNEILGIIGELRTINSALDAAWDGEASMAFEAEFGDWLVQLEQFSETLESVYQYLMQYVESRRELDSQAASAAQGTA